MRDTISVTNIEFTRAPTGMRSSGLLGWVKATLGPLELDGLTVRRTLDGRLVVGFPERVDRSGFAHALVRPTSNETRRAIEGEVIAELRRRGVLL